MKVLECSSRGDKRFSAFYAQVRVGMKMDSIENHYQMAKRFKDAHGRVWAPKNWREAKGLKPDHFEVNGMVYPLDRLSEFYYALWYKYLTMNPDLVRYAQQFDEFHDMFARPGANNQADCIRDVLRGRIPRFDI